MALHLRCVVREPVVFFAYVKTMAQIICTVTAQLISAFVFATKIIPFLYFLNPKFQVSSHLLWLYNPVCVGPGRKLRRPIFSRHGSYLNSVQLTPGLSVMNLTRIQVNIHRLDEPRCEKTSLRGFRPGPTQTGLFTVQPQKMARGLKFPI